MDVSRRRPAGSWRWSIGGLTLAALIVASVAACADSPGPARGPTTELLQATAPPQVATDAVTSRSTDPPAAVELPAVVLERHELPQEEGSVWLQAVAAGDRGAVAVGGVAEESLTDAAVWVSQDGAAWMRVVHDEATFGDDLLADSLEAHQYMVDVVVGPFGILAVGVDGRPPEYDAVAWMSADGTDWWRTARDDDVLAGPGAQILWSVVSLGDRFVAVGESANQAAIWVSDDGRRWEEAIIRGAPGDNSETPSAVYAITVGGPGLVAVGSVGLGPAPSVWVSSDGVTWDRLRNRIVADGSGVEDADTVTGRMTLVFDTGDGLVAIAATAEFPWLSFARPAIWRSVDGIEWRKLETGFADTPRATTASIGAVARHDEYLIAVGGYEADDPGFYPGLAALWISCDGGGHWAVGATVESNPWESGPLAAAAGAVDLARFGRGFIVVGSGIRPTGEEINGYPQYVDSGATWIATIVDG